MKRLLTLFLCLIVPTQTAIVVSAQALIPAESNSDVILTHIQLGGSGSGTTLEEYVILYNRSDQAVNITDWCLEFSSDTNVLTANYRKIVCFTPPDVRTQYVISGVGYMLVAHPAFLDKNLAINADFVFSVLSNIPGTNGSIRLIDEVKKPVDMVGWGSGIAEGQALGSLSGGNIFARKTMDSVFIDTDVNSSDFSIIPSPTELMSGGVYEEVVEVDVCSNIAGLQTDVPEGFLQDEIGNCLFDVCPDIEGLQLTAPVGYYLDDTGECRVVPLEDASLLITELYPNAPGVDSGNEFIEIYNPTDRTVLLNGYRLQVGPNFSKEYVFSEGSLLSGEYRSFSDSITGIVLPNSNGVVLRLVTPAGTVVSESDAYSNAKEAVSWAYVDGQWIYTNQITPNDANKPFLEKAQNEILGVTSVLGPCAAGKYRNPETNRCRNLETAVSTLKPCDENQYRNPETNRCRNVASASSNLVPCKPGQERNPETNRCRSIAGSSANLKPCAEGQERNPATNRCRKVAGATTSNSGLVTDVPVNNTEGSLNWFVILSVVLGTCGYIAYEWRTELRQKVLHYRH